MFFFFLFTLTLSFDINLVYLLSEETILWILSKAIEDFY